jgi:hypothetical protein
VDTPVEFPVPQRIGVNQRSSAEAKIALFRSLFRGREDVYARRFVSRKTGRAGYHSSLGRVFVQGIVDTVLMIVVDVITNQPTQVIFIQDDHMVQQFPASSALDATSGFTNRAVANITCWRFPVPDQPYGFRGLPLQKAEVHVLAQEKLFLTRCLSQRFPQLAKQVRQ